MIATETTEDTEGKYSVLSVYSVAETILYIQQDYTDFHEKKSKIVSIL